MKEYKHADMSEYIEAQVNANIDKFKRNWVSDVEIGIIANWVMIHLKKPEMVLCHGARNGYEMFRFGMFFGRGTTVLGTDISPTASEVPDMVVWDFHEVMIELAGKVDMVYSNSLDHSYNPVKAIKAWMETLKPSGVIIIHWTPGHDNEEAKPCDCFQGSWDDYNEMISSVAQIKDWVPIRILKEGGFFVVEKK